MVRFIGLFILILFGLILANAVFAQGEPLNVTLEGYLVNVVTNDDGTQEEEFVAATTAHPGQIVEYRVTVTNVSNETVPASGAFVTGPVPATTTYLADSATPSNTEVGLEFSADGGVSFTANPMTEKVTAVGNKELVAALPEEFTTTRWTLLLPIEPQHTLTLTYRVTVN